MAEEVMPCSEELLSSLKLEAEICLSMTHHGLDVSHQLPALLLRQPRPRWHPVLEAAVSEQPEQLARCRLGEMLGMQSRLAVLPPPIFSVARCAVLRKQFCSSLFGFRVGRHRVRARSIFGRNAAEPLPVTNFSVHACYRPRRQYERKQDPHLPSPQLGEDLLDFIRHAESHMETHAVDVQSETRRNLE